jgi:YjbE family integral membrane protein
MDYFSASYFVPLLEIIWIDILLSGDNAVVIALACRSLPPRRQKLGIGLGAAAAVLLRIVFATVITQLLAVPYLRIAGGALLLWIAVKLLKTEEEDENQVAAHETLFGAVRTIVLADLVMSLDNVVAVAAAAKGQISLFVIGLLISIPFVVGGASLLSGMIQRYPALIWFGGALLGWISGEMIASDPYVIGLTNGASAAHGSYQAFIAPVFGAAIVVAVGHLLARRKARVVKPGPEPE